MKCEWVQENILLYVYNELADDARYELEQHVARCADCAAELEGGPEFNAMSSESPGARAFSKSAGGFPHASAGSAGNYRARRILATPDVRSGSLAAPDSFCACAGGGSLHRRFCRRHWSDVQDGEGNRWRSRWHRTPAAGPESSITGIQSIPQQPGSNQISIKYNTVSTQEAQGSLNDQRIQQLLLFAARNNYNSGVRMDSVDLLTQKPERYPCSRGADVCLAL